MFSEGRLGFALFGFGERRGRRGPLPPFVRAFAPSIASSRKPLFRAVFRSASGVSINRARVSAKMEHMNAYANSTHYFQRGRRRVLSLPFVGAMALFAALILSLAACQSAEDRGGQTRGSAQSSRSSDPFVIPTALPDSPPNRPDAVPEDLSTLWEVWAILNSEHVDRQEFDPAKFDEEAIRGLIRAIGDPHTNYVPPEVFQIESQDIYGSFEGIGANVQMRADGKLIIVAPIEGGPAEKAGLRPGDLVLAVNGESLEGLSLLDAVNKIRGPKGSEARLLILHLGAAAEEEVTVVRDTIDLPSVLVRSRDGDRFAHIRLTTFYQDTPANLSNAIRGEVARGAEGVILDVRDNPGGLLGSVIDVVSLFIENGVIMYEVNGAGQRADHRVRDGGEFADLPLVLLTNEGSASASEILAGALKDYRRAPVVGATTFGKGSVNQLRRLGNGGGLFLTFAKWYTPSGQLIEGNGVQPDHEVTSRDRQKADTSQFEKAVEVMEGMLGGASSVRGGS